MGNSGKITIFLCLLLSSMLLLGLSAVRIIDKYMAKSKISMSARTTVSGIMAEYNSYIYEHYHILLFDKTFGGKGEGYLEECMLETMQGNLGGDFQVEDVMIQNCIMLTEQDCAPLKNQIVDYMGYAMVEYGAEQILAATGGKDGTLSEELEQDLEESENQSTSVQPVQEVTEGGENETAEGEAVNIEELGSGEEIMQAESETEDPRMYSGQLSGMGLLAVVIPEDMTFSDRVLTGRDRPSIQYGGLWNEMFTMNNEFNSYSDLKQDLQTRGTWKDALITGGTGIAYAADVFNCATDYTVNDTSVLHCELEYLVCGNESDVSNVKEAVNQIIAIRLPVNYAYLMSDPKKSTQLTDLAMSLMFATGIPEPIIKRLLAGAWAYVEAVAEIRNLMAGKRLSFTKNDSNWLTQLDNLGESMYIECEDDEHGLAYKDYLLILLSLNMDKAYYRMLDIMQLNVREQDASFSIMQAAVGISVDIRVSYDGDVYGLRESAAY